jgi:regulator of nucleoside diphosphate kinase
MSLRSHQFRKPSVYVAESQYERLAGLAGAGATRGARLLGDELVRAIVLKDGESPREFVRLHSFVEFSDLMTGRTRRVQIVPPEDADIDQDRLSVLTPVGATLIGLTAGDSMGMSADDGRPHVLVVDKVESVHEAA